VNLQSTLFASHDIVQRNALARSARAGSPANSAMRRNRMPVAPHRPVKSVLSGVYNTTPL
jgi:hypothetical protein